MSEIKKKTEPTTMASTKPKKPEAPKNVAPKKADDDAKKMLQEMQAKSEEGCPFC